MPDDRGLEITLTLDGRKHVFRYSEITAVDVRDCRRETGFTLNHLLGLVGSGDIDIDTFAALIWFARRQNGERTLRYDAVATQVKPTSELSVDVFSPDVIDLDSDEADDDPETSAEPSGPPSLRWPDGSASSPGTSTPTPLT